MKSWTPIEICLLILTLTVPLILVTSTMTRLISGSGVSEQTATLLADLLKVIVGGVLGIIGSKFTNKNQDGKI